MLKVCAWVGHPSHQSIQAGARGGRGSSIRTVGTEASGEARLFDGATGAECLAGFGLPTALEHLHREERVRGHITPLAQKHSYVIT